MPGIVKTSTQELGESRVRVEVEVEPGAVERELETAAAALGRDLKIPGFRKGKVPPQVVLQRVGRTAVLDEAIRGALPRWYEDAISDARLATVGDPKLDLQGLPDKGDALTFSIEIGVRPKAELGEWRGVEVPRREAQVAPEQAEAEIERLRESLAALDAVDRPAQMGDYLVLDFEGSMGGEPFEGGDARGFVLELGSDRLIPGFDEQLVGARAGDEPRVTVTFPDDYRSEHLAGHETVFACAVKEVKAKRLPELDDDFAAEAAGFDTLAELREDVERRLLETQQDEIDLEYNQAVVDAVADAARIDVPHELVHAKAHEAWHNTARQLQRQGIDPARYLEMTGKTTEELAHESEPEAERALRRESVLAAIVEAEGIEVSDDELMDALRRATAAPGRPQPSDSSLRKSLEKAKAQGRDEALREDIAMRKAVDVLVAEAKPIPSAQAEAREKLWTPDRDAERGEPSELWTPGS